LLEARTKTKKKQSTASFNFERFLDEPALKFLDLIFELFVEKLRGVGKESRPSEDQDRAEPQGPSERVREVDDREDEGEELPEGEDQGDGQRGAFRRQKEH